MSSAAAPQQTWNYKETAWLREGHGRPIYCGAFNHWAPPAGLGDLLATVGANRATIYRCRPGGDVEALQAYCDSDNNEEYYVCAWSLDAATGAPLLLLAGAKGLLLVLDALTGTLQACFEGHGGAINDIAVHPTRPHLAVTASRDHSLRLWNLRTRCCVLIFQGDGGHRNEVLTLSWKAGQAGGGGDDLLLSAGMDSQVKVWSLAQHWHVVEASDGWRAGGARTFPTGRVTMPAFSTERAHFSYVDCLRWLGDWVLSKSTDNRLLAWRPDASTPAHATDGDVELIQELRLEECDGMWWVRFSLDYWRALLAVGTRAGRVLLYDPHAQQSGPKARLKPRRSEGRLLVRQTAVSYDGSIVVACHEDGSLTRFDRVPNGGSTGGGAAAGGSGGAGGRGGGSSLATAAGVQRAGGRSSSSSGSEDEGGGEGGA